MAALADALEADTGGNHPDIGGGPVQVSAEILEDRRVLRWGGNEVVDDLVDAGRQAGVGDVVTQNAPVYYLSEESGLGQQLGKQVRNVLVAVGHERFVVPSATTKRNDDCLPVPGRIGTLQSRAINSRAKGSTGNSAKEIAAADGNRLRCLS